MLNFVVNLLENERDLRPMNDQDHSLSLSDPDRSLVLSHLLVNFLKNLVSCQTSFTHWWVYTLMVNLFQILNQFVLLFRKNVIEKSSMIWRVLPLVKINTRISETPCICKPPHDMKFLPPHCELSIFVTVSVIF
jgi:hypothetical protein